MDGNSRAVTTARRALSLETSIAPSTVDLSTRGSVTINLGSREELLTPVPPETARPNEVADKDIERLASVVEQRQATPYERWIKPVLDRALAGLLLIVISPVLIVAAVMVAFTVGRPVLFRQRRIGQNGQPFSMLKFRTMLPDRRSAASTDFAGPDRRTTHKSADDPRHTRLGRLMRKTSIDELPQLLNVLRGQMSLVGPRPELIDIVQRYTPWQHSRHCVKPGVTGVWQTTERGEGRMLHECIDLDLRYIAELSFRHDLAILLRTPVALLRNKGVI